MNNGEYLPEFADFICSPMMYRERYKQFREWIAQERQKRFNNKKVERSDEEVIAFLFTPTLEKKYTKSYARCLLTAILKSLKRNFHDLRANDNWPKEAEELFKDFTLYFFAEWNIILEHTFQERPYCLSISFRPTNLDILYCARYMLNHYFAADGNLGYLLMLKGSVFFIRQFIETRLLHALGIFHVINKLNAKYAHYRFSDVIDFIKDKITSGQMSCQFDLAVWQKIYEWSNTFIHTSLYPDTLEIDWAVHLLFKENARDDSNIRKGIISINGAFWIDRNYYGSSLYDDFLNL